MALIDCSECGHKISDRAPACPHCGIPIARSPTGAFHGDPQPTDAPIVAERASRLSTPGPKGHIFLSYQSDDRARTRVLAEALERRGWPVWWDRDIQAGQAFRNVIGQALDDAGCVVVLWSKGSIGSEWVQEEAQIAKSRNILVPVLIDAVRQPLGFGQTQSTSLVDWGGDPDDPALNGLLESVARLLGFDALPRLLDDHEWATIVESTQAMKGRAATARASHERSAAEAAQDAAERASADRDAAALAGHSEAEAEASGRQAKLAEAARIATQAAERREAAFVAELAEEHAAQLRTLAARKAAREADTKAAEDAAQAAKQAADRTEALRVAAAIDKEAAEQAAAGRAPEVEARARTIATDAVRAETSWFRFPKEGVATLIGGVIVVISVFLVWDSSDRTALELAFGTIEDGNSLGIVLLVVGIVGGLLALVRIPRWITVILGLVAVTAAILFLTKELQLLIDEERAEDYLNEIRIGSVAALLGGLFMLSGR